MTVTEFLEWDPGDDRRYELIGGVPLAMAPPSARHALVVNQAGRHLAEALSGADSPCRVLSGAGIRAETRDDMALIPDVTVTCEALDDHLIGEPRVLIEVLSPSTDSHDRRIKLPIYQRLESVQEVVFLDSRSRFAEVYRRQDGAPWTVTLVQSASEPVELPSLGIAVPLGAFYEGFDDTAASS